MLATSNPQSHSDLEELGIKFVKRDGPYDPKTHLFVGEGPLSNGPSSILSSMRTGAFLLLDEKNETYSEGLEIVAVFPLQSGRLVLRRKVSIPIITVPLRNI